MGPASRRLRQDEALRLRLRDAGFAECDCSPNFGETASACCVSIGTKLVKGGLYPADAGNVDRPDPATAVASTAAGVNVELKAEGAIPRPSAGALGQV